MELKQAAKTKQQDLIAMWIEVAVNVRKTSTLVQVEFRVLMDHAVMVNSYPSYDDIISIYFYLTP